MTLARPWLQIFLAGCVWTQVSSAQTGFGVAPTGTGGTTGGKTGGTTGGTAPRNSPTDVTGTSETTTSPSGTTTKPSGTTTAPGGTTGGTQSPLGPVQPGGQAPADPFGFGNPLAPAGGVTSPTTPFGPTRGPGASTTFGLEPRNAAPATTTTSTETTESTTGPKLPDAPAPQVTAPSFYGKPGQVLTPGSGRFARPRFRYFASVGMGFDDNTQQTPDNQDDIPGQVITQVIPAEPEVAIIQETRVPDKLVPVFGGGFRQSYRTVKTKVVLRPAVPEQTVETVVPGVDFGERNASIVSRANLRMDAQWISGRSAFTLDGQIGADYYWSRDVDPLEFNGSLAATYLRRLGPKMQFTGNVSLSYQSQPDYSQVNLVDTPGASGGYFAGNLKLDLSYRWAPRFSTVTSLTGNSILYEGNRTASNYWEMGLGNEFRWMQSAKTTWVAELRYSQMQYLEGTQEVIDTAFLLLGADLTLTRRIRATMRFGESIRTYESTGGSASTPYGEIGLTYQPTRRDQISASARYGFEQTASPTDESIVARLTAGYTRTFSPRMSGSLNVNYVNTTTTSLGGETTTDVFDGGLFLRYMFTRRFSMNARYSYTLNKTSSGFNDYDRSRFFLTGEYEF